MTNEPPRFGDANIGSGHQPRFPQQPDVFPGPAPFQQPRPHAQPIVDHSYHHSHAPQLGFRPPLSATERTPPKPLVVVFAIGMSIVLFVVLAWMVVNAYTAGTFAIGGDAAHDGDAVGADVHAGVSASSGDPSEIDINQVNNAIAEEFNVPVDFITRLPTTVDRNRIVCTAKPSRLRGVDSHLSSDVPQCVVGSSTASMVMVKYYNTTDPVAEYRSPENSRYQQVQLGVSVVPGHSFTAFEGGGLVAVIDTYNDGTALEYQFTHDSHEDIIRFFKDTTLLD